MYNFTYHRPQTAAAGDQPARQVRGGETARRRPDAAADDEAAARRARRNIIDLHKIEGMSGIELKGRSLVIGAMTRHADVAHLAGGAAGHPGARQARRHDRRSGGAPHRGTIGGSVANNDPNADYPAACLGLGATIITNKRHIVADDFFKGMFETALEPTEIITKVSFPIPKKAAYQKFRNPASRFALVGVFVAKRGTEIRVAVTGAGAQRRVPGAGVRGGAEEALFAEIARRPDHPGRRPDSDIHGSAEYRAHLVGVLARRAVAEAIGKSALTRQYRLPTFAIVMPGLVPEHPTSLHAASQYVAWPGQTRR